MKKLLKQLRTRYHNDIHAHLSHIEAILMSEEIVRFRSDTIERLARIETVLSSLSEQTRASRDYAPEQLSIERLLDRDFVPIIGNGSTISFSQLGQDKIVESIFMALNISKITYLDVGANHPIECSNTALFYRGGSSGYAVEANPNFAEM